MNPDHDLRANTRARACFNPCGSGMPRFVLGAAIFLALAIPRVPVRGAHSPLGSGLSVKGEVSDERGRPIVGAVVRMRAGNGIREAVTRAEGIYQFDGCDPGAATLAVMAKGRAPQVQRVEIHESMKSVDFWLKPGGTVRVRVLDERGNPLPKARVSVTGWGNPFQKLWFAELNEEVDSQGVWEWKEAPPETLRVQISRPDGMLLPRMLTARQEEYVFRVPPALVMSGSVIDAETKRPIKQFRVIQKIRSGKGQETQGFGDSVAATNGHYLTRGTYGTFAYVVRIEADGYSPVESRDIKSDEGNVSIDFALSKSVDLVATVLTADGTPAAKAKVALGVAGDTIVILGGHIHDDNIPRKRWMTDEAGRFHFPPRIDKYWLVVTHPAGFTRLECGPKSNPASVRLTPWARVEGTFRVGRKFQPHAPIMIQHRTASEWMGQEGAEIIVGYGQNTDDQGRFRFDRVIPGHGCVGQLLELNRNEGSKVATSACLVRTAFKSGETTHLDLGVSGRPVIGQLRRPPDSQHDVPWSFALVSVKPEDPKATANSPSFSASVDREGNFCIDDVPAGNYVLNAYFWKPPRAHLSNRRFTVPAIDEKLSQRPVDLGVLTLQHRAR